jgi:hypothetical protein
MPDIKSYLVLGFVRAHFLTGRVRTLSESIFSHIALTGSWSKRPEHQAILVPSKEIKHVQI